jgi:release factor glutamine methyltransferase
LVTRPNYIFLCFDIIGNKRLGNLGVVGEPIDALVAGPAGTEAIQHIIKNAKNYIKPLGWLFIEHGYNQAEIVKDLFKKNSYQHIENAKDIHGVHRVTFGQYSIV